MIAKRCLFGFLFYACLMPMAVLTKCPSPIECGYLGNFTFPFTSSQHPDCGILVIHGCDDYDSMANKSIKYNNTWYDVVHIGHLTITIRDDTLHDLLLQESCKIFSYNFTFTLRSPFASSRVKYSTTLLRCNKTQNLLRDYDFVSNSTICRSDTMDHSVAETVVAVTDPSTTNSYPQGCSVLQLPTSNSHTLQSVPDNMRFFNILTADVSIEINLSPECSTCYDIHGGLCRLDGTGKFYCDLGKSPKTKVKVAAVASVAGALGILTVSVWCFRRRFRSKKNPTHQIIEMFLNNNGHLAAKRYSYSEIKKATNSFRNKLGQGGYGSVYKGRLNDGTCVAIKVLSDSKGNGEEFINEVASISVTSHVNIVNLLGFCLEGSKRALIYKYMPNGSLEKFIYEDKDPLKLNLQLTCKAIYNIAIGVARGLEYLHRGCNTKILHFDIKPNNILLDEDFVPKISDFGLAKICPKKESIVSLLGARGTAGYIAPEVFSRNFGAVSHKSDVYSYGMMILEMVGGRDNNNVDVERSSEVYFPHWIYKHLELNQEPKLRSIKNEVDREMVRKMIIVSLWCIQTDPSNRPAMNKVVEMMEGNLESLQMPPKPYLSSPPRSPPRSSDLNTQTSQISYTSICS